MTSRVTLAPAAALVLLTSCAFVQTVTGSLERPKLTFESWSAEALDLDGVTIALRYRLENPNGFGLDLRRLAYKLEVEGRPVGEGELPAGVNLAAHATTPLAIPVRLRWKDIPAFAETLLTKSEVAYRISGEAGVGSPVGTIGLPFDHQDRVALPRLPSFSLESVALHPASLSQLALDVRLRVENGNAFPLPVGALTYGLRVGGEDVAAGGTHPLAAVPPRGHATITVPIRISLVGAADAIRQLSQGAEVRLRGLADYGGLQAPLDAPGHVR